MFSYADILVISLVVFALVFAVYFIFALVTFLLRLLLGSLNLSSLIYTIIHWVMIIASLVLAYGSIKYNFGLSLPLIYGLLLITLALS